jgi:cytoplasmic iron level regulating protein YaaA (DUF328/UPF0246 family)
MIQYQTMKVRGGQYVALGTPRLRLQAKELVDTWCTASSSDIESLMKVSPKKAEEVKRLYSEWSDSLELQTPAIDTFVGDIYSGLQVQTWSLEDRTYAQDHLLILSGLYGGLRACDGVMPYRLEMGYKLPDGRSMYQFWGDSIASLIPSGTDYILNLSAVEYTKALLPHSGLSAITPKFLTINPKTGQPTFVAVHAKIARGAFARWVVQHRIEDTSKLIEFQELGYHYNETASTPDQPVFICEEFGGLGLSVRLV